MIKRLLIILISLHFMPSLIAQDELSAIIDIRFENVELKRDNSDLWFPLSRGAIAFIGEGDTIRTRAQGRVDIIIDESIHILLLSNSDFSLSSLTNTPDGLSLSAIMNGNAVIETSDDVNFNEFNVMLNDLSITEPANLMSIWSFPDIADAVTVAKGEATVFFNETTIPVPSESGFLAEPNRTEAITFEPEWHAAGLEAGLYSCPGISPDNVSLLVRTGPGQGFQAIGALPVNFELPLMGQTETTGWTRVQFLTGFGWVQSLALKTNCTDLEVFPDDTPEEKFITLVNVSDDELELLEPFFESPATNAFSYQFVLNS